MRQPLAPFELQLFRLTVFLGALVFVGGVVVAFVTDRPLVAAFATGASAAGTLCLLALLWITRRM